MDDRFDERLRTRLSALDAAVPTVERDFRGVGAASTRRFGRGVRTSARLPLGLAAGLVVAVVGVAIVGASLRLTQNGGAPVATGPVATGASPVATGAGTQSPAQGMTITDAQALPIPGITNPVIVTATIANGTGRDDKLIGGSSPVAAAVGLYGTCACSPAPTDPVTGIPGVAPFPWWLIKANETIQLRAGAGEMVLSGLSQPLAAGQTVEVTFKFAYAAPVTVEVPVVSTIGSEATASPEASGSASAPAADQTPSPADAAAAKDEVDRYTAALVRGDYATAYGMLAPESQGQWQSLADFIYERSAFFKSVAGRYVIQVWPSDVLPLTSWLRDSNRSLIDQHHAVLVEVDYPALDVINAGYAGNAGIDISPGANGLEIFQGR